MKKVPGNVEEKKQIGGSMEFKDWESRQGYSHLEKLICLTLVLKNLDPSDGVD